MSQEQFSYLAVDCATSAAAMSFRRWVSPRAPNNATGRSRVVFPRSSLGAEGVVFIEARIADRSSRVVR